MIADGIIMSKFIQLIQLWGGAHEYLLNYLQVLQNRAARMVTKCGWFTTTESTLRQCGWLSIRQLVVYHNVLQVYKVKKTQQPKYLYNKLSTNVQTTRHVGNHGIRENAKFKSDLGTRNFTFLATKQWNTLPPTIRTSSTVESFKKDVKNWIQTNIPI